MRGISCAGSPLSVHGIGPVNASVEQEILPCFFIPQRHIHGVIGAVIRQSADSLKLNAIRAFIVIQALFRRFHQRLIVLIRRTFRVGIAEDKPASPLSGIQRKRDDIIINMAAVPLQIQRHTGKCFSIPAFRKAPHGSIAGVEASFGDRGETETTVIQADCAVFVKNTGIATAGITLPQFVNSKATPLY